MLARVSRSDAEYRRSVGDIWAPRSYAGRWASNSRRHLFSAADEATRRCWRTPAQISDSKPPSTRNESVASDRPELECAESHRRSISEVAVQTRRFDARWTPRRRHRWYTFIPVDSRVVLNQSLHARRGAAVADRAEQSFDHAPKCI